jgi:hypothetical protein
MACTAFSWLRMGPSNRLESTAVTEGERLLGRPCHGWQDIKVGLADIWHVLHSAGSGWAPVTDLCVQQCLKGRDHLGDLDIDGRMLLKQVLQIYGVDCIQLAQDGPQ